MFEVSVTVTGTTPESAARKLMDFALALDPKSAHAVQHSPALPAGSEPAPQTKPEPQADPQAAAEPTVDMPTIRSLLVDINQAGKQDEVKSLLAKYGADRLSGVAPENYDALYADAQELAS